MAGLRNLGIGALHLAGRRDISEATRWAGRNMHRPFQLLGLTPGSTILERPWINPGLGAVTIAGMGSHW
jgi:hypothetical protein